MSFHRYGFVLAPGCIPLDTVNDGTMFVDPVHGKWTRLRDIAGQIPCISDIVTIFSIFKCGGVRRIAPLNLSILNRPSDRGNTTVIIGSCNFGPILLSVPRLLNLHFYNRGRDNVQRCDDEPCSVRNITRLIRCPDIVGAIFIHRKDIC